jgi:hypothetical protein
MKHHILRHKHLCAHCHTRPALFRTVMNPDMRADDDHDLCSRCYRAYKDLFRRRNRDNGLDG